MKENYDHLLERPVGLIIENTEVEDDVQIFYGEIKKSDNEYYFTNLDENIKVSLDSEKLMNAKKISAKMRSDIKSFENCEYSIWMKLGILNEPTQNMNDIGLDRK